MSAQREPIVPYSRLHDDAEEDLVGADWHQEAIRLAVFSLRDLALLRRWPWHVGDQLPLVGWKPDGSPWRPSPDVMVHPLAGPAKREEIAVSVEGPPALIIEVLSKSSWAYDVDVRDGKAFGYLSLGVPEYLTFDPNREFLGAPCRAWQQWSGTVAEWQTGADGRYHSRSLGITLEPQGDLLRVFDPEGQPVAFEFEKTQRIAALEAELARLRGQSGTS